MTQGSDMTGKSVAKVADRRPPKAALDSAAGGALAIEISGAWDRIFRACGSASVSEGIIAQVAILGAHGKRVDEGATNFALGFVDAMEPTDAAEALLLTQMAATHQATMMLARRLNHVNNIPQQDAAERALNKLGRTFAAQMDTLKRYRSKGQQTVRVERVTVEGGGQAIVGNVEGGRGREEK